MTNGFDSYQAEVVDMIVYPRELGVAYTALGLNGEAGEYAEKIKKGMRDGVFAAHDAMMELGDVLWYVAAAAHELGYSLADVANFNLEKLDDRRDRGVVGGSGDAR
jgi:NTP pyrophosphatase (non-canonical NTP hydrolase)